MLKGDGFVDEAIRILTVLGYSASGKTQKWLESMMSKKGYRKGYNGKWFMSDDINPETETRA